MVPSSNGQFLPTPTEKTEYIHNFINTLQLSNYYNDTIEIKKLEWLLDVEDTCTFVQWICNYIGPDNILSDEEINEYLELTDEGIADVSLLNESQLHDELSSSVEVTEESVASIEEEILELDTLMAVIKKQVETLRPKSESLKGDVLQQCERRNSIQRKVQEAAQDCNKVSEKLDLTCARFVECILPLNNFLNNSHTDQKVEHLGLLSQMPFKDLKTKCDRAAQNIDFIRSQNNLEQEMLSGNIDQCGQIISGKHETALGRTLQKMVFCKEATSLAKSKLAIALIEKQELVAALGFVSNLTDDINADQFNCSRNKLMIQQADAEYKSQDFLQVMHESGTRINNEIGRLMNAHLTQVSLRLVKKAKRHQDNNFECRQMMLKCLEDYVYHLHLFFTLLIEEKHKLHFIASLLQQFTETLNEEIEQLTERIERMKVKNSNQALKPQDDQELWESSSLQRMLLSLTPTQPLLEGRQLLEATNNLNQRICLDEQKLLHASFPVMEETLNKNFQSLQSMAKTLFSGATNKPVVVDPDLSSQLYNMSLHAEELRERLNRLIAECEDHKVNQLANKYSRNVRLLWVHFLTEYERINVLIAEMERAIREQTNQHT